MAHNLKAKAQEKEEASSPSDWVAGIDPNTKEPYWFNKRTEKTQWTNPHPPSAPPPAHAPRGAALPATPKVRMLRIPTNLSLHRAVTNLTVSAPGGSGIAAARDRSSRIGRGLIR